MIKAVIFDMFETLVSMFSGDTYFSEDMAHDMNLQIDEYKKAWHITEHDRASFIMCYVDLLLSNLEDVYEIQVLC